MRQPATELNHLTRTMCRTLLGNVRERGSHSRSQCKVVLVDLPAYRIAGWLVADALGIAGGSWLIAISALIGIVFLMIYGVIRVLRGGNL